MNTQASTAPVSEPGQHLSFSQKIFLTLGVPLLLLVGLDCACRLLNTPAWFQSKGPVELEMPTWMQTDPNAQRSSARITTSAAQVDWLNMFQSGNGFRVHLIPGIERPITNTFSQISADKAKKYLVRANSLGFRGKELPIARSANSFRVLIFGDSSSFGWGVDEGESYWNVLETKLQEKFPGRTIEIGNFAIPGDSTEYGRLIFDSYITEYAPDLVIIGFGANDAKKVNVSHTNQVERFKSQHNLQMLRSLAETSYIFKTLESAIVSLKAKQASAAVGKKKVVAVKKKRYIENLTYMGRRSLESGATGVVILNLCTPGSYAKPAKKAANKNKFIYFNGQALLVNSLPRIMSGAIHPEIVEEMRQSYGRELKRNSLFYITSDSCHPNKLGHQIIGEELAEVIGTSGLL